MQNAEHKSMKQVRVLDMHAHLLCLSDEYKNVLSPEEAYALGRRELMLRREYSVATVFSCGTPQEWEFMQNCLAEEGVPGKDGGEEFLLSFGIHPWYSNRYRPSEYREYFQNCVLVGEIGMDSVWCDVPLDIQRRIFQEQLDLAAELGKSVILHTKGQESQIAEMIRDFPGLVCVHWYSGRQEDFEKFLEAGCYFTLGPDLSDVCLNVQQNVGLGEKALEQPILEQLEKDGLYRRMLREIPPERLFLETDGASAIAWAKGVDSVSLEAIPVVLEQNLVFLAKQLKIAPQELRIRMRENLKKLCGS